MALISLAGAHGAPGVTALAVALAHRLPDHTERTALLLEADPDGGTMAARHAVDGPPGFTALASLARQGLDAEQVLAHCTPLRSGVPAIVAHPAAEQAHAALRAGAANIAAVCAALPEHDVVADLGRLRPGSPARPLAAASRCLVLVARPEVEQLVAIADRLSTFAELAPLQLVLIGQQPYRVSEVERVLGLDDIVVIADDPAAVRSDPAAAGTRRSAWRRSVDSLAARLAERVVDLAVTPDPQELTEQVSEPIGAGR